MRKKSIRSYSGPHFPAFPRIWTEYYLSVFSPNAGKCRKNAEQNNSEYGLFLRSVIYDICVLTFAHAICVRIIYDSPVFSVFFYYNVRWSRYNFSAIFQRVAYSLTTEHNYLSLIFVDLSHFPVLPFIIEYISGSIF